MKCPYCNSFRNRVYFMDFGDHKIRRKCLNCGKIFVSID